MKLIKKLTIYSSMLLLAAGLLTCSDSESKLSPLLGHTSVIINLGLPPEDPSAFDTTIWNKIRSFFVRDAVAQTAPASFGSILVRVTGPDIGIIEQEFGPFGAISLNVPSGSFRQFEVIAYVSPTDPSAALSFRGTTTANLPEGETVNIPVIMGLYTAKIVLPDTGFGATPRNRILQIDDISGAGYTIKTGASISFAAPFRPWDIDFDSRGRIYIATNGAITNTARVIRLNNINATSFTLIADNGTTGLVALAVDRANNYVYFTQTTAAGGLRRCNLDGTGLTAALIVTGTETIGTITGMDVDANGMLYMTGNNSLGLPRVFQYNPSTQSVIRTFSSAQLSAPEDVRVMLPYIYVANSAGAANLKILQLDSNLQFVAGYGSQTVTFPNTSPAQFYAPRHFVAIRNDSLIIIDDYSGQDFDKLVSIGNITGAGWTTLPTTGNGQSLFGFYYGC